MTDFVEQMPSVAEYPVLTRWFHAYLLGNNTVPQSNVGINIALSHELLHNPPDRWAHFANSRMSDSQIHKIKGVMDHQHERNQVPSKTTISSQENEKFHISDQRLADLWAMANRGFFRRWTRLLIPDEIELDSSKMLYTFSGINPTLIESFDTHFKAPNHAEYWRHMTELVEIAYTYLFQSPDGKALSARYRTNLVESRKHRAEEGTEDPLTAYELAHVIVGHAQLHKDPSLTDKQVALAVGFY
jgi:hypothetical protein